MTEKPASDGGASAWPFARHLALITGLEDASRLIESGISELHNLSGANDSSHGMLHLLSHGFERLIKYTLFQALFARDGVTPDAAYMKDIGHDVAKGLAALLDVVSAVPEYANRPAAKDDLSFMREDQDIQRFVALFSRFGKRDRYFDLNVLIDPKVADSITDPSAEWRLIENDYFDRIPGGLEAIASDPTALGRLMPQVTGAIAEDLERLHRALARMWFWGALGQGAAGNAVSALAFTVYLEDDDLGKPR